MQRRLMLEILYGNMMKHGIMGEFWKTVPVFAKLSAVIFVEVKLFSVVKGEPQSPIFDCMSQLHLIPQPSSAIRLLRICCTLRELHSKAVTDDLFLAVGAGWPLQLGKRLLCVGWQRNEPARAQCTLPQGDATSVFRVQGEDIQAHKLETLVLWNY